MNYDEYSRIEYALENAIAQGYKAGAEDMREKAARTADDWGNIGSHPLARECGKQVAQTIRAIPIEDKEKPNL